MDPWNPNHRKRKTHTCGKIIRKSQIIQQQWGKWQQYIKWGRGRIWWGGRTKIILLRQSKWYIRWSHDWLKINYQGDIKVRNDKETEQYNEVREYQHDTYNQEEHVEDNQKIKLEARNV